MIALLDGILIEKTTTYAIISCGGVGFLAYTSFKTFEKLPHNGSNVKLFTHLIPREDSINLYAFYDKSEKAAFLLLISIAGIGPKSALGILSAIDVDELQEYVLTNNLTALNKMPGVGKKTAERLVIELKDKISSIEIQGVVKSLSTNANSIKLEAVNALVTLGFSMLSAEKAVNQVITQMDTISLNIEDVIKMALRKSIK